MEPSGARLRSRKGLGGEQEEQPSEEGNAEVHRAPDLVQWTQHMEAVKTQLLEQAQGQLVELLDRAMREAVKCYSQQDRTLHSIPADSLSKIREPSLGKRKVFITRKSLLDELMEVQHFRTIYHMFIAGLCVFIISTLAIDFIDGGRLGLELDLLIFSFGQLPLALMTWVPMFLSTLLVPYQALRLWARPRASSTWILGAGMGCALLAIHVSVLCVLPVHIAREHHLPPASRCVLVFEQVRLLMKSYSFLREAVPGTLSAREGKSTWAPSFSSYLYFLFCPTLIYRETYPRTPSIRWNYVAKNFAQALGCVLYACFILGRLCIPVFANMSREPFSTRALVLSILHATLPGIFILLLIFFAFLHCWQNAFAEMLRFGDRMFYRVRPGPPPAGSWRQGGAAELHHERPAHGPSMECAFVDLALSGPGHSGQPVLPGVVCAAALSPVPDYVLGAGDTSILVLPSLEVMAPALLNDTTRLFSICNAQDLLAALPHLALSQGPARNTHQRLQGLRLGPCGQLSTDSAWG
ncbi:sterol O-acyltransferase 2 isoform X2 [Castor canadensis]|uniref:Sterol O-acyltransferase 2 isoform X2 n=1 Tax=Castor canadensis TaxID=51338 RepID=A0AC58ND23_CASCN